MRRSVRWASAVIALLVLAVAVAACGGDDNTSTGSGGGQTTAAETTAAPEAKTYTIGLSAAKIANPAARVVYGGFKYQAEQLGMKVQINDSNLDINKQVSDIDTFTNQGTDAIVVHLVGDPNAIRGPLQRANDKGISIMDFDGMPPVPGLTLNAFQPSDQMGIEAAKYVTETLGGKGTVIMTGAIPIPVLEARVKSATEELKKSAGLTILKRQDARPDDESGGRQMGEALLSKYKELDAIICVNDDIAAGVSDAVAASGRKILVVGMNASKNGIDKVKQGRMSATIDGMSVELGMEAAKLAKQILDGEVDKAKLPLSYATTPKLYTKENVSEWVDPFKRIPFPDVP